MNPGQQLKKSFGRIDSELRTVEAKMPIWTSEARAAPAILPTFGLMGYKSDVACDLHDSNCIAKHSIAQHCMALSMP